MPLVVSKQSEYFPQEYQKLPLLVNRFKSQVEVNQLLGYSFEIPIPTEQAPGLMEENDKEFEQETSVFSVSRRLEEFYIFENTEEIVVFVGAHIFLENILLEAPKWIESIFGKSVEIHLELHRDPEENFEELFIVIKSPYAPKEARKLMDKLGEQWFLDIIEETQGKLCITERPL